MAHHKALVLSSYSEAPQLQQVPTPEAGPGQVVVRILAVRIREGTQAALSGKNGFPVDLPLVPGGSTAIGRTHAVGPDAIKLKPGKLVLIHNWIRGRDDPSHQILLGLHNGGPGSPANRLMQGEWRDATMAEYCKAPLENVFGLDEERLIDHLGYQIPELLSISAMAITLSGIEEVGLRPGDTVILAPATGTWSGLGVAVAIGYGARVIAAARNKDALKVLEQTHGFTGRIKTVALTGDVVADSAALKVAYPGDQGVRAYIDWSPPAAAESTHMEACMNALDYGGRVALLGYMATKTRLPYSLMVPKKLSLHGRFMSEHHTFVQMIRMVEAGNVRVGKAAGIDTVGTFGLHQLEDAVALAEKTSGWNSMVALTP